MIISDMWTESKNYIQDSETVELLLSESCLDVWHMKMMMIRWASAEDMPSPPVTLRPYESLCRWTHSILTGCRGSGYPRWSPEGRSVTQNMIVSKLWPLPACTPPSPPPGEAQDQYLCSVFFFSGGDRRHYALAETAQHKKGQKAIKNEDNQ